MITSFSLTTMFLCAIYGWGSSDERRLIFAMLGMVAGIVGLTTGMGFAA